MAGIEIPFELPGQDKARLALEQINASLTTTQREVVKLASSSETGKKAFGELEKAFSEGKLSADQVREALLKVASQAPKTAEELKQTAREQEKLAREQAKAAEETRKAAEEARRAATAWNQADAIVRRAGEGMRSFWESGSRFGEAWRNLKEPISDVVETIERAIERTAELAAEQSRLDRSQQELGLSLRQSQAYAGGFAEQTAIATTALTLQGQGIRLTQQELDALTRLGMRRASDTGKEFSEVMENLTETVTEGGEELGKVSPALLAVADSSHTAQDRLAAMVVEAGKLGPASRTAADELGRLKEQVEGAQRAFASGFAEETTHLLTIASGTRDAADATEEWNTNMRAVGATAAYVLQLAIHGVGAVVGAIGYAGAAVSSLRLGVQNAVTGGPGLRETFEQNTAGMREFLDARVASLEALANDQETQRAEAAPGRAPTAGELARNRRLRGLSNNELAGQASSSRPDMTFSQAETGLFNRSGGGGGRPEVRYFAKKESDDYERLTQAIEHARAAESRLFAQRAREADASYERRQREVDQLIQGEQQRMTDTKALEGQMRERENERRNQRDQGLQLRRFFREQADAAVSMADTVRGAYEQMTDAASSHFAALVLGQETAGEALQGFVHDTLTAFAKIAAQQAVLETARGFAALFFNPAEAAAHFGAALLFGLVAGGAGALAQATAPAKSAGADRAASNDNGRAPRGRELRGENDNARGGGAVINVFFGGPMYGTGGVRRAAREIGGVLNAGAIQGGVELAPAVGWG